ncbi:MAG: 1-phosphofructokinase family hexose kinase [Candidatus Sericytochromatia bacterium]|nr:1-phosphofructokinase family hexose kinase [Candidatus Sericytochromatia bacterium]
MFLTVTLNAAIDKTLTLSALTPGGLHRPVSAVSLAGGKGINVSRALRTLGEATLATGLVAGVTGEAIVTLLLREGIPQAFHAVSSGESRTCIALLHHRDAHPFTEINEVGPPVAEADYEAFVQYLAPLVRNCEWLVLSGSLPPGLGPEAYTRLIRAAKAGGKRVSLDTSGPELPALLTSELDVLKPNQAEAEGIVGRSFDLAEVPGVVAELLDRGPRLVALTMGAAGAAFATHDEAWWLPAPAVEVVNPIGSGDACLAALLSRLQRGEALAEAARWGVAAGSANAMVSGAAACYLSDVEALLPRIRPVPLDALVLPTGARA